MRSVWSWSGMWRFPAWFMAAKYSTIRIYGEGYYAHAKEGEFFFPDIAGAWQFWPWWEVQVKEIIGKLRNSLFVDIGANIGYFSVLAGKNGNQVISIEPNLKAWRALVKNTRMNGINAEVHNLAAWSKKEPLHLGIGNHTDVTTVSREGTFDVLGVDLDTLLAGRKPDLIKIDAERSESEIFAGMQETLKAHPLIIFEALGQKELQACLPYLGDYKVKKLDRCDYYAS